MTPPAAPRVDRVGAAQHQFETAARAAGFDPEDRWVGGYADYEWDHLRPALAAHAIEVEGRDVLELGCNSGGSSVVLAALGARLSGVDIDPMMPPIAAANLARHGLDGDIRLIEAGGVLPFANRSFDLIVANSVLEYVEPRHFDATLAELHRLLRPDGTFFICGTASRLALRERHSGRWLVNYLPTAIDRLTGRRLQRGLSPWRLACALRGRFDSRGSEGWIETRLAIHGHVSVPVRLIALLAECLGISPGWIAPHIELSLRRS